MLGSIAAVLGMLAVGLLVWRALERQGHASPPTDDPADRQPRPPARAPDDPDRP